MGPGGQLPFLSAPLAGFLVVGVLALLLRWTFSHGHSLVEKPPVPGKPTDYGLLEAVASPPTFIEAEALCRRLEENNIRATLAPTTDGPRVLVFKEEARAARAVLRT